MTREPSVPVTTDRKPIPPPRQGIASFTSRGHPCEVTKVKEYGSDGKTQQRFGGAGRNRTDE